MSGDQSSPQLRDTTELPTDRRANGELRKLIEEMMDRLREMNRKVSLWGTDEKARAEAELESIMARVRRAASQRDVE